MSSNHCFDATPSGTNWKTKPNTLNLRYITFHGHQQNSAAYLKALDILLMTSDHKGLPMATLEAMALGTPIVSHNIGALKFALQNQQGGVLSPKHNPMDHKDITYKILERLASQKAYEKRGAATNISKYDAKENITRLHLKALSKASHNTRS